MVVTPTPLHVRLAALVYDLFPLIGLWMATAALALLVVHGDVDAAHPPAVFRHGLRAALLVVTCAYFALSWTRGGQTIGMRAWRLRLVDEHGGAVRGSQALLRFAVALLSLAAAGIGFFWSLVDHDRRTWHDIASGTTLVRLPKP